MSGIFSYTYCCVHVFIYRKWATIGPHITRWLQIRSALWFFTVCPLWQNDNLLYNTRNAVNSDRNRIMHYIYLRFSLMRYKIKCGIQNCLWCCYFVKYKSWVSGTRTLRVPYQFHEWLVRRNHWEVNKNAINKI